MDEVTFCPIKVILLGMDNLLEEHSEVNFNGITLAS